MAQKSLHPTGPTLAIDLVRFDDDFVEFTEYCAFMCDAFARLAMGDDYPDAATAGGISRYCYWLKHRMEVLKEDLKAIHKKAHAQSKPSDRKT